MPADKEKFPAWLRVVLWLALGILAVFAGLIVVITTTRSRIIPASAARNLPHRLTLSNIYNAIQPGMTKEAARLHFGSNRTEKITLNETGAADWYLSTPFELGAGNWTMFVEFSNSMVSAVRIRTMDGPPPKNGPPDKP